MKYLHMGCCSVFDWLYAGFGDRARHREGHNAITRRTHTLRDCLNKAPFCRPNADLEYNAYFHSFGFELFLKFYEFNMTLC